ncbi:MAG: recombinase family protein [Acidimicrobiales bacterium]|jgi:hypothetical protein
MLALAAGGRWLGGRPNYGYRVVNTGLPHPNRSNAAAGAQLRSLELDPETAPVVRRIFELFDAGVGCRSIAARLEAEGLPSPGEVGPTRHPRSAGVWGGSVVHAILLNPRYLGHQVAGCQRRFDELLNADDPALGTISRQRWQGRDAWSWSEEPSWPAIIPADLFERVNRRITNAPRNHVRGPRTEPGKYVFSGAIQCGHCGNAMFGVTMKGKPYYRCTATGADYAVPSVPGHPPTYAVREERILAAVDAWLDELTDPDRLDSTVATIVDADEQAEIEPAEVTRARHQRQRLQTELDRLLAAIRAGMDPMLAAGVTRKVQAELRSAECVVEEWERSQGRTLPLDEAHVRAALAETRDSCACSPKLIVPIAPTPTRPWAYGFATKEKGRQGGNESTPSRPYEVAGEGFEPSTFGL